VTVPGRINRRCDKAQGFGRRVRISPIDFDNLRYSFNQPTQCGIAAILRLVEFFATPFNQPTESSMSLINTQVQPFKTQAFHNGKFVDVSEQSLKG
jgi:hypothetical protein